MLSTKKHFQHFQLFALTPPPCRPCLVGLGNASFCIAWVGNWGGGGYVQARPLPLAPRGAGLLVSCCLYTHTPPPTPWESNNKVPKFDGNSTYCCSYEGRNLSRACKDILLKIADTTPTVALTRVLLSQGVRGGGGGLLRWAAAVVSRRRSRHSRSQGLMTEAEACKSPYASFCR